MKWGTRSYENFALGLAVLFTATVRTVPVLRPIPFLIGLAALAYFVQGW
ncbi:MAG: hypothetical protein ACRD2I_08610 [Vicinamibacterales bacterium]